MLARKTEAEHKDPMDPKNGSRGPARPAEILKRLTGQSPVEKSKHGPGRITDRWTKQPRSDVTTLVILENATKYYSEKNQDKQYREFSSESYIHH